MQSLQQCIYSLNPPGYSTSMALLHMLNFYGSSSHARPALEDPAHLDTAADDLVLGGPCNSFLYQMHVSCIASAVFKATSSGILSN